MATCAIAVLQADGSYLLAIDPSVTNISTCTYVVESGADIANSILNMSAEDGGLISGGLITVWVAAWGVRQIIAIFNQGSSSNETV